MHWNSMQSTQTGKKGVNMPASALGSAYSPPSPPDTSSSATMSPVYPDRPIRPLPRRSLRERLSPEVADSITYPPAPTPSNPTHRPSHIETMAQRPDLVVQKTYQGTDQRAAAAHHDTQGDSRNGFRFKGNEVDSDDEGSLGMIRQYDEFQQMPPPPRERLNGGEPVAQSVASSNDSVDGYDSFENTNNKKKRKIPTSGPHSQSLPASLSAELANLGISDSAPLASYSAENNIPSHYYGNGMSESRAAAVPTGVSGMGRNRLGRHGRRDGSGRSPLAVSTNGSNALQARRATGLKRDLFSGAGAGNKIIDKPADQGIISAAIAEANALPSTPQKGQEHVSLLDQEANKKSPPSKTQFTFTCESDSSKNMMWPSEDSPLAGQSHPGLDPPAMSPPSPSRGFSTQGTQTSPTMAGHQSANGAPAAAPPATGKAPGKKSRRSLAKQYALAARDRRLQQEYNNYHQPPRPEDIWICEFCEYESIFGHPPTALIRSYEAKDLQERERLEEKRRLLEKAKMKGRKGKKGGKNAAKNNNAATAPPPPPAANNQAQQYQQAPAATPVQGYPPQDEMGLAQAGTQSDEYFPDVYDSQPPTPMPVPSAPSKIPQPVAAAHA